MFALFPDVLHLRGGVVLEGGSGRVRGVQRKGALEQGLEIGTGLRQFRTVVPKI